MTIGIAAYGPNAGLALFRALRAVERVGTGCIGGFVSFAAISAEGRLLRAVTQRGGTSTLFIEADLVGADPPAAVASAPVAALMSSGPDRPEPLQQFVAGDASVGLVTGHRFANQSGRTGIAFNQDVLLRMQHGADVIAAVDAVISDNRSADIGLIAVDLHGRIHARNSERVLGRPDLGGGQQTKESPRAVVTVLHNAIHPLTGIAAVAAEIAMETMHPAQLPEFWIEAAAGTPVVPGAANTVEVDATLRVTEVRTTDASLLHGVQNGAAIYIGSEVLQDGKRLGLTMTEPYVVLHEGVIESLSGQARLTVSCRRK